MKFKDFLARASDQCGLLWSISFLKETGLSVVGVRGMVASQWTVFPFLILGDWQSGHEKIRKYLVSTTSILFFTKSDTHIKNPHLI